MFTFWYHIIGTNILQKHNGTRKLTITLYMYINKIYVKIFTV